MKPNFKDRKPAIAGSRSFFPVKHFVIIVSILLLFLGWYATRLVVAVLPEQGKIGRASCRERV